MSRGYLLDTNIAIAILVKENTAIDFIHQAYRDKMPIYFSTITECEIFAGLKPEEQLQVEKLFTAKRCIEVTSENARIAGTIRREQKGKGRKLKTPDAIIIAAALVNELTLISRDSDMNFVQHGLGVPFINI